MLSERVNRIIASPTMKVAAEAKRLKAEGINVIDLSVGETDFPTPANIKEAAKKAIDENHTKYTINAGTVELRKAIADKFKKIITSITSLAKSLFRAGPSRVFLMLSFQLCLRMMK